jgi:Ca2+/Na+ antiporter
MNAGWIGGIAGSVIGLIGGIIGTYFSIKNTNGPRERAFMVKAGIVCWIAILLFFGLMLALPSPYRYFLWIPYAILLSLGIVFGNRTQRRIRNEESQSRDG